MKKIASILIMLFVFVTEGISSDYCTVSSSYSASLTNTYTKTDSVNISNPDNYYFTAPSAGTVTITLSNIQDNRVRFNSGMTSCPSANNGKTTQTLTLTADDLDFNVKVFRTTGWWDNGSSYKNYTITVSFTPSTGATVNNDERTFALRNPTGTRNLKGNVRVIGNTVLCVKNAQGQCYDYTGSSANNQLDLQYIDVDGVTRTYNNSSQALLSIPTNAVVKWAGIYTQGYLNNNNATSVGNILKEAVYVTVPGVGTITSAPTVIDILANSNDGYTYDTFAPLNALVGKTGSQVNGWVTGANIKADTGTENSGLGNFGAWTLVVVYESASETLKNISVFDGYRIVKNVTGYKSVDVTVSGFLTPLSGSVHSTFSLFAGEGDKNIDGDKLYLNNTAINSTNAFYSTLSGFTANPSYSNTQGIDIQNHEVGKDGNTSHLQIIGNNTTSATMTFTTSGDTYFPSLAVFATELYIPDVCYEETITHNGTAVSDTVTVGDILDINVTVRNQGQQPAVGVSVEKQYDETMPYIPDSMDLRNTGLSAYAHQSDASGDDLAEYDENTGKTKYYVGTGASASGGGTLSYTQNASFHFQVEAAQGIDTAIENQYLVSYQNTQLGIPFTGVPMNPCAGHTTNPITIIDAPPAASHFDAWDSFRSIGDRTISTKIANKAFTLTVASLNDANNALQSFTGTVCARMIDSAGTALSGWNQLVFNAQSSQTATLTLDRAIGGTDYARVALIWKKDAPATTACGALTDTNSTIASDRFAVRPSAFSISASNAVAGVPFGITFTAPNGTGTASTGYNESAGNSFQVTMAEHKSGCVLGTFSPSPTTFTFVDGTRTLSTRYSETGVVDINISDLSLPCTSLYARIDCTDANVSDGSGYTADQTRIGLAQGQITIVPHHFDINATLSDFGGGVFTYLSTDLNMSSSLSLTATAKNGEGGTTSNYSNACYAKNTSLNLPHTSVPSPLSQFLYREHLSTTSGTASAGSALALAFSPSIFTAGAAPLTLDFNFDRDPSRPLNPFAFSFTGATLTDSDAVTGTGTPLGDAEFLYGRVRAYDVATNVTPAPNPVEFEVYSTASTGYVAGMPQNVLNWYRNLNHSTAAEGNVIRGGFAQGTTTADVDVTAVPANGVQIVAVNSASDRTVHLDIAPWLWYSPKYGYNYANDCRYHPCFLYDYTAAAAGINGVNTGTFGGSDFQMTPANNVTNKGVKLFR